MPVNSINLNGAASFDSDGYIQTYSWQQIQGPNAAVFSATNSSNNTCSGLIAGTYVFALTVTDDSSAVDSDSVEVLVLPPPAISSRYVRVNVFGGANAYNQDGWNNWNVPTGYNISSAPFQYSDGGASSISALLGDSQGLPDNGTAYGGSMCPPQVLRYTSYSTSGTRGLLLRGLKNSSKYDVELYASRATTGNTTIFVAAGVSRSVNTDNNKTQKAVFTDLVPTNGQITIQINRSGTFTYLNGFTLIEKTESQTPAAPPQAHAGNDTTVILPAAVATLNASRSQNASGLLLTYNWVQVSGPSTAVINQPNAVNTSANNLVAGTYVFEVTVTNEAALSSKDQVQVTVLPARNTPPVAAAGADQQIMLPQSTTTLNGTASSDADGRIVAYEWTQKSGAAVTADNLNAATVNISALTQGNYVFTLKVTDDSGAVHTDEIIITVTNAVTGAEKEIRVNLFGGVNPYLADGWNNWNVSGASNIGSQIFNYTTGASSGVTAVLNNSQGVPDNGTSYGGTMCAPQVLRYTTYSTAGTRAVLLKGLNTAATYAVELYASRANNGNQTIFVINGISKSITTDFNKGTAVLFEGVRSNANGELTIHINRNGTFTYLNGFVLKEQLPVHTQAVMSTASMNNFSVPAQHTTASKQMLVVASNPFGSTLRFNVLTPEVGKLSALIYDAQGNTVAQQEWIKEGPSLWCQLNTAHLGTGIYYLTVRINGKQYQHKIMKQQ